MMETIEMEIPCQNRKRNDRHHGKNPKIERPRACKSKIESPKANKSKIEIQNR